VGISFNTASLLNGNGIDVNDVVSEIQAAQSGQLIVWQQDQTTLQTQATALNGINTDLSNLATAVTGLSTGALTAVTASSSESAIASATAQTGATAANYNIVVNGLATTGTLYTDSIGSANTSILPTGQSTGDFAFQIGGSSGATADIAITAGSNDTLTTLAASINAQSAAKGWNVTASVVSDASGSRLAIYSQSTGSPGALAVTNNTTSLVFEPPVGGTDAEITINGIPYASTSNTVTGAIPDVTLTLTSADSATPVQISVGPNVNQVTNSIDNFVTEYNTVVGDINSQFTVNAATNSEGPLGADTSLRILQSSLLSDITYATTDATSQSSGITNLASLGITLNNDGTLSVNSAALTSAVTSNPSAVENFFQNSSSTGFADNLTASLNQLTDPAQGILNSDLNENQTEQNALTTEITDFQSQLATQKIELDSQFSQVNANLEEYPFLLQEVTQELGSISSSSNTPTSTTSTNTTPTSGESTG
jgi:flagellar hook-associated protein 2